MGRQFASSTGFAVPLYSVDMDEVDSVEGEIKSFFDSLERKGAKSLNLQRLTHFISSTFLEWQVFLD